MDQIQLAQHALATYQAITRAVDHVAYESSLELSEPGRLVGMVDEIAQLAWHGFSYALQLAGLDHPDKARAHGFPFYFNEPLGLANRVPIVRAPIRTPEFNPAELALSIEL